MEHAFRPDVWWGTFNNLTSLFYEFPTSNVIWTFTSIISQFCQQTPIQIPPACHLNLWRVCGCMYVRHRWPASIFLYQLNGGFIERSSPPTGPPPPPAPHRLLSAAVWEGRAAPIAPHGRQLRPPEVRLFNDVVWRLVSMLF